MSTEINFPEDDTNWSQVATWIRTRGLEPAVQHANAIEARLDRRLTNVEVALGSEHRVRFIFEFEGQSSYVDLHYETTGPALSNKQAVTLEFRHREEKTRIFGLIDQVLHEFRPSLIRKADYHDMKVYLKNIVVLASEEKIAEERREKYGDVPSLERFEDEKLAELMASRKD